MTAALVRRGALVLVALIVMTLAAPFARADGATAIVAAEHAGDALLRSRPELAGARIEIDWLPLDVHAAIADCSVPLAAELVGRRLGGPRATVRVRCADPQQPWSVALGARLRAWKAVAVAQVALARGDTLDRASIVLDERDVLALGYGYIDDVARISGARLLRPVAAGAAFAPGAVAKPWLVERGRQVTLVARGASIDVRASGTAVEDGLAGDRVRVRNSSSGHTVGGIVEGPGLVAVER